MLFLARSVSRYAGLSAFETRLGGWMSDSYSGSGMDVRFLFGFWDGCLCLVTAVMSDGEGDAAFYVRQVGMLGW
jgi:hypothetical protein